MGTRGGMASREKAGQMKPKASPQEKVRTNLLQLMLGRQAPTTKKDTKLLLHRMVFLAKISPELADKQDLAGLQRGALLHPEGPARHAGPAAQSPLNLPDAVLEEVSNLIIPQDTIYHLLECRELLSPAQFLQAYDSPLNVVMDSGHMFGSDNPYAVARVASAWEGEAGRCELVNEKDLGPMDAWGMAEIGGVQATAQALLQPTAGHAVLRAWLISAHDRGEHPRAARESGQRSLRLTSGMMGSDGQMGLTVIIWGLTSHWLSACDTRTALTELWYCRERERERERESVCVCV
ncbi:uncharacterized protein LOC116822896 isoform X3 [Chelonoidis abingdonii]|uniref:uncharacterized protein LOC116822896 isoform X3 n=1 Tax=Chelonoidis abingdonii TaxID=106734 RepID=UPI003F491A28